MATEEEVAVDSSVVDNKNEKMDAVRRVVSRFVGGRMTHNTVYRLRYFYRIFWYVTELLRPSGKSRTGLQYQAHAPYAKRRPERRTK